jgi:mono/diheme cytochrome c family protein
VPPKPIVYSGIILLVLALIPPAVIAWARATPSGKTRIHIIQDMDAQMKVKAQQAGPLHPERPAGDASSLMFRDRRGMRPPVTGAVARGELADDEHYVNGVIGEGWATTFPARTPVTMEFLQRGRERYDIYCALCHGLAGYGDGIVHERAMELVSNPLIGNGTTWVQPKSLHDPAVRDQPVGQVYNTIANGIRNMAAYGPQIPVEDRWAIVAYVEALQRSQNAREGDVPADVRSGLEVIDLMPVVEEEEGGDE